MKFSNFGEKFRQNCGILTLMDDLGKAAERPGTMMLGGGNPSRIPQVERYFRQKMLDLLEDETVFETTVGTYSGPEGSVAFIQALAKFFQNQYGWSIGPEHIALTNGSQTAFYLLFNMLAGRFPDGRRRKILLPLAPEYIGYEDVGLDNDLFVSYRPEIEFLEGRFFKYRVDFKTITIDDNISAVCVSRPTNPTGNVLTENEIFQLSQLAKQHDVPLIIDNAYGLPFPGIIFSDTSPHWEPHIILSMSLSKLGLPGVRTGILVAHPEIIRTIKGMNAVISLAPSSFGPQLALDAIKRGEILHLSQNVIRPHYRAKVEQAVNWCEENFYDIDYFIHQPEGAIFLWIWFKALPITTQALYELLKTKGVIVVPGHNFFPGLESAWNHKHACIRISYAADAAIVERGIAIIGETVRQILSDRVEVSISQINTM